MAVFIFFWGVLSNVILILSLGQVCSTDVITTTPAVISNEKGQDTPTITNNLGFDSNDSFNLSPIPYVCPEPSELLSNLSSTFESGNKGPKEICGNLETDEFNGDSTLSHCTADSECQIGSKCCPVVAGCSFKWCIDLKDRTISERIKRIKDERRLLSSENRKPVQSRRRRQSFGCVSCACVRNCQSSRDCSQNVRRKRCYRNVCSSYCTL